MEDVVVGIQVVEGEGCVRFRWWKCQLPDEECHQGGGDVGESRVETLHLRHDTFNVNKSVPHD